MSADPAVHADLVDLVESRRDSGSLWSAECEDLDCTFVAWQAGQGVVEHVNSEVDVIMVVISGSGKLSVNGEPIELKRGKVVVVHKAARREIEAAEDGLAYLNVHKRRKRLQLGNVADRAKGQIGLIART